ncbi:MAG: pilus assembly protein TadG-related protein [Gemmatimonadota bacterium]
MRTKEVMMNRWLKPVRNERGATFVFFVAMTLALLSLSALAADVGMLMTVRSEAQRAAEAAALAGAGLYMESEVPTKAAVDAKAREFAGKNHVGHDFVNGADSSTVEVEVNEAQQHVRVTVGGTARLLFARLFGRADMPVSAVAAARVTGAGGARCVKPFALPDLWAEGKGPTGTGAGWGQDLNQNYLWDPGTGKKNDPPAIAGETWNFDPAQDYYKKWSDPPTADPGPVTGYGGSLRDATGYAGDQGRPMLIKAADPGNNDYNSTMISPGQFLPFIMEADPTLENDSCPGVPGSGENGAGSYCVNIAQCNNNVVRFDTTYSTKSGNMAQPTGKGLDLLIGDDQTTYEEALAGAETPRVIKVALFDPLATYQAGTYDSNSGKQVIHDVKINNIALIYVQGFDKDKNIIGRFMKYADGATTGSGSTVRILQIVE